MAASSGDLVSSLIEGGISPAAASIIANALANASSPQFSSGNDRVDSTPREQLRLITPETRKYHLTNLDYSTAEPFQKRISENVNAYAGGPGDHPYKDSQPVSPTPPLAQPAVRGSDYITVNNVVERNSNISEVSLDLRRDTGGRHLRLDPSTKSIESVPFIATPEVPRYLASEFRETEKGTELVHGLRNLATMTVALDDGQSRKITAFAEADAVENGAFGGWLDWTPSLTCETPPTSISYSKRVGKYFRIGQLCFVHAEVTLATTPTFTAPATSSQNVRMTLPLVVAGSNGVNRFPVIVGAQSSWITTYPAGGLFLQNSFTLPQINFRAVDGGVVLFSNVQQNSNLVISGFYQTTGVTPLYPVGTGGID